MKIMKKTLTFLLVAVLLLSVSMVGFAAGTPTGSITVQDNTDTPHNGAAISDATYTAYQILELESYDAANNVYSYKATTAWAGFVSSSPYFSVDAAGYVTASASMNAADLAAAALTYAEDKSIGGAKLTNGTASNLPLGYYLVDTTVGSLCALTTTNPDATVEEKNVAPTITKTVDKESAKIGDTVIFTITVDVQTGAENYVVHDTMPTGLTFGEITSVMAGTDNVTNAHKAVLKDTGLSDSCTFELPLTTTGLAAGTNIVIEYTATLNKNAEIDNNNTNTARLAYGTTHTVDATASVTTHQFHLVKTDNAKKLLTGAKFRVYTEATGGTEIPLVLVNDAAGSYYRPAVSGETGVEIVAGNVTIKGLAKGTTYYLEETEAPTGYNKLTSRVAMDMTSGSNTAVNMDAAGTTYANGGQQIVNNAGTLLPSTGGMGTTVFYVLGSIFAIGALVILVTRKRMAN